MSASLLRSSAWRLGNVRPQRPTQAALKTVGAAGGLGGLWWLSSNEKTSSSGRFKYFQSVFGGRQTAANCCGIVGYIGDNDVAGFLMGGVRILQNRGYDSCGISTIDNNGCLITTKYASKGTTSDCIDLLNAQAVPRHSGHHIGIAHTRWATHGAKTDVNAHPHSDYKSRISLVHNGTIENYNLLKADLQEKEIDFTSGTDTEVIANLIGWHLDQNEDFEGAVSSAVASLSGTWGLAVIHKDYPDQIVVARNGSPLLVGFSERELFVASEPAALAGYTNHFMCLRDGEICVVSSHGIDQLKASRPLQRIPSEMVEASPDPYPHWTLKEICEQPQSLGRALNFGGRIAPVGDRVKLGGLDASRETLMEVEHMVLTGCGTSYYAALYGERLMQYLGCFQSARCIDAAEMTASALPRSAGAVLLLSQSGETLDTVRACTVAENAGLKRLSVVNAVGSMLARMTNCGVYLNAGREVAVASTKAFSSQVVVLTLIATWFAQGKGVSRDKCAALMSSVHRLPVYAGMTLDCHQTCRDIAAKVCKAKSLFVLGKDLGLPVAYEAALKIKEIAYIHAEGFAAGALKHGPFALIDEGERTPVILIAPADEHSQFMRNVAEQLRARGAFIIAVGDDPRVLEGLADEQLIVPPNGQLTTLLCIIPLQILAYELAVLRGINPDKPRGLAKTVTVA